LASELTKRHGSDFCHGTRHRRGNLLTILRFRRPPRRPIERDPPLKARGLSRIINWLGLQAQESSGRRKLPVFAWDEQFSGCPRVTQIWLAIPQLRQAMLLAQRLTLQHLPGIGAPLFEFLHVGVVAW